jgi:hypothetical protein
MASVGSARLAAASTQRAAAQILARFKLDFPSIRLMQTVTGAVISGSAMTALVRPTFIPGDLDFLTGAGRGIDVVDFLMLSANYSLTGEAVEYEHASGTGTMWPLHLGDDLIVNVIESPSPNPLDYITHFHLSCLYGAWMANGIWHGYARITAAGTAVTTAARLPLDEGDITRDISVWNVLHKYMNRGFTIGVGELPAPHECGRAWDCPATLRTTKNDGCSYSPFSAWRYDDEAISHPPTCWAMGGTRCPQGILLQGSQSITSSDRSICEFL